MDNATGAKRHHAGPPARARPTASEGSEGAFRDRRGSSPAAAVAAAGERSPYLGAVGPPRPRRAERTPAADAIPGPVNAVKEAIGASGERMRRSRKAVAAAKAMMAATDDRVARSRAAVDRSRDRLGASDAG